MVRNKLISVKGKLQKFTSRDKKDNEDYLTELKKERKDFILKRAFENSKIYTIFGIFFLCIYVLTALFLFIGTDLPTYIIAVSLISEFIGIALMMPFYSELKFFNLYYRTYTSIKHILYSKQTKRNDSDLENFQINYNNLRKKMKKQIITSKGNFLTYDYEISRIVQEIDTFFDSTTKILFKKKIMRIPYLPIEELEEFMEEMEKQYKKYNTNSRLDDFEPPNEYDPENYKIKEINFRSIEHFMRIYGYLIIKNPRKKVINTVAIAELFRKWNLVVKKLEPKMFEESKKDVGKYYSKKQERKNYIFSKAYEIFVIFLITILSGLLLNYFT